VKKITTGYFGISKIAIVPAIIYISISKSIEILLVMLVSETVMKNKNPFLKKNANNSYHPKYNLIYFKRILS
jgi:hypothetical protein